ncbi:MAG: HlyD family secretion protein [Desulfobulbus oligotrophicus]|nr:HlyD family secretion protein [Desulfobulbus oligotrophicus]
MNHDTQTPDTQTSGTQTPGAQPSTAPALRIKTSFKLIPWAVLALTLVMILLMIVRWEFFEASSRFQYTNNAYIQGDVTLVDAQISGYVKSVNFADFQRVKANDLLVELIDDEYRATAMRAEAELERSKSQLLNLDNEVALQQAAIDQARAEADRSASSLDLAKRDYDRFRALSSTGAVTGQEFDNAKTALDEALAAYRANKAAVAYAQRQLEVLEGERAQRQASLTAAQADLETAKINLAYTRIIAPVDGQVSSRKIQVGTLVNPGTQVAALVHEAEPYIIANYKETQLSRMAEGQTVLVRVDAFPDAPLEGIVERISPASGSTFSLLPSDNATGNFTKVVQRIPVRIVLKKGQQLTTSLRAGMSVTTEVDTGNGGPQ